MTATPKVRSGFYGRYRIEEQRAFYDTRRREYERAHGQAATVTTTLLLWAAAAGVLGVGEVWLGRATWAVVAAACSALAATTMAWSTLMAFEENARLFRSAECALYPLKGRLEDRADDEQELLTVVARTEEILQAETSQWGQHLKASASTILLPEPRRDDHRSGVAPYALPAATQTQAARADTDA
jgi:conflict system pore-forming effector with SLATT domain